MRYRPFGVAGQTVSAVTVVLGERPDGEAARLRLVYTALEAGVNSFELRDPSAARVLGEALSVVERRMLVVSLRLCGSHVLDGAAVLAAVEQPLLAGRLQRFDAVVVQDPHRLTEDGWRTLATVREASRARLLGVCGEGVDAALARPEPDLLVTQHHLGSGWADRNRMTKAAAARRTVIGEGYHPVFAGPDGAAGSESARRGLFGLFQRPAPIEKLDGYGFLRRTPNWAADEICLAHALLEPTLASVVLDAAAPEDVDRLAAVTERELPTGLSAQIEMARFAQAA